MGGFSEEALKNHLSQHPAGCDNLLEGVGEHVVSRFYVMACM